MMEPMNANSAMWVGTPRLSMMGSTMMPMLMTGPAPVMDVKITAVTRHSSDMVIIGRSPPSSTVLRIREPAMPVSMRTRPKNAPKKM